MAPHSSTLAWKIPWAEEPGRLQSMGVTKSQTRMSNFIFTFHFHALEREMATHSSDLAWRIPGAGEPGNVVLVSAIQQSESAVCIHVTPPTWTSLPPLPPTIWVITEH